MIIALIIALAGILLFLLLSPVPLSQAAAETVLQRNEIEEAGLETIAHELQLRGEAHQHG
ncbi:hypothetical protein ACFPYJ_03170 [Paenibacillus solisilvae]|uniref:Uncharacterized protein n=1 Tax=Paenibacillus solisilvae TaxID=2486751 RepID=A0ABW0VTK4_9BACL